MRHNIEIHAVQRIRKPVLKGIGRGRMVPDMPLVHLLGTINGTPFHAFQNPYSSAYNILPAKRVPRNEYEAISRKLAKVREQPGLPEVVIPFDESMMTTTDHHGDNFTDEGHERVRVQYVELVESLRSQHPEASKLPGWRGPNELTPEEYQQAFPNSGRGT